MLSSPAAGAPAFFPNSPVWVAGVAQTASKLLWVRDELSRLDVVEEAYVPTISQVRTIYGKQREIETPIPGWGRYFFMRLLLDPAGEWARARYQDGVRSLLPAHSLKPLRIADRFIQSIKDEVESGKFAPAVNLMRRFLAGEAVDVVKGHLLELDEEAHGTVIWQRGARVKLTVSCAGAEREVILPADQLAPSGSPRRQTRTGSHLRRNGAITRAPRIARAAG